MSSHLLVEVPPEQWTALRDLYGKARRVEPCGYNALHILINWWQQSFLDDMKIYSLDGDWQRDGTYIIHIPSLNNIFCNSLDGDQTRLKAALNCLDQQQSYSFQGIPGRTLPTVKQYFQDRGYEFGALKKIETLWYHVPKQKVEEMTVEIPEGVSLKRLTVDNAEQVNKIWPHRSPGSVEFVKLLIIRNSSVGVFDSEGNLQAWCLIIPVGGLGMLQVEEAHKRKGLATLMVKYMSREMLSCGLEVMAPVVPDNKASRSMFEKLGFSIVDRATWMVAIQ